MTTKEEMIENQLVKRDITDPLVLEAMRKVDRKLFVPDDLQHLAYEDGPLPIGESQTISQPYIVAYMAQELRVGKVDTVLEVGTGCGYHAAVLASVVEHVYSIEIIGWLADLARENLQKAGVENVSLRRGDGYKGWPEKAPFDGILLTASPKKIPEPIKDQLKIGGTLLAPVGSQFQKLMRMVKTDSDTFEEKSLAVVSFVPMTGHAGSIKSIKLLSAEIVFR